MTLRIGIDLGGTKTEGIVMDATGAVLFRERRPTPAAEGYEAIFGNIRDIVRHLEAQAGGARCPVGIGTPGATSAVTGALKNSNTTCLIGKPIRDDLEKRLARPVRIANDANCFALSEALDGAGMNEPAVFGVILGTGVGGGIVVNGQLLEGLQHIAGEWGHNVLGSRARCEIRLCRTECRGRHDSKEGGGRAAPGAAAEMSGAANDELRTKILPNVHGDSSGVRGGGGRRNSGPPTAVDPKVRAAGLL